MLESALEWVESLRFVSDLRSSTYFYPLINAGHILGVSLLVGSVVPLDLRLLGLWRHYPVMVFLNVLRLTAAAGLALAVGFGVLLFATSAVDYARSPLFQIKLAVILLGVLNAMALARVIRRRDIASLPMAAPLPLSLRVGALVSLVAWLTALLLGRFLGYF